MEFPTTMQVGPVAYEVVPDADDMRSWSTWGRTHPRIGRITYDPAMPVTQRPLTMLHEALHAMGYVYGIDYWKQHGNKDEELAQYELMVIGLVTLIRDNPRLIAGLQGAQGA